MKWEGFSKTSVSILRVRGHALKPGAPARIVSQLVFGSAETDVAVKISAAGE